MDIRLEVKKLIENNEMFYKYSIDNNLVWFSQKNDNGNIYSIHIKLKENFENFKIYIASDESTNYFPKEYIVDSVHITFNSKTTMEYQVEKIKYLEKIATEIMNIFKLQEHYDLWFKNHKSSAFKYLT